MVVRRRQEIAGVVAYYERVRERDILRVITDVCDKAAIPYMRNYPNKIVTAKKTGEKILARVPSHQKGKPDVTVLCLAGLTVWIETKALKGVLSPDQLRWKEWIITRGHEYHAPRTVAEAHAVADHLLAVGR
jgi:hypothetical protein